MAIAPDLSEYAKKIVVLEKFQGPFFEMKKTKNMAK